MLGQALNLRFSDFDAFRENLQGWDTEPVQLGAGHLNLHWSGIDLNGLRLNRLTVNRKVIDRAAVEDGALVFVVCFGAKLWCGNEVEPGSLVVIDSGRDHRNVLEPNWESIEISTTIEHLVTEGLPVDSLLAKDRGQRIFPLPEEVLRQFRELAALVFGNNSRVPLLLPMEQLAVKTAVHSLLRRTAAYIRAPGFEAATLRQRNGYRLASAAMALVEQNPGSLLEAGDVATSLGVSRRALNYAFRETLGNSTYKYMLANRLNTAKRDLRANSTQSMTVTEVATNNDFYHLGRFAAQYHRLFGELPSQTLAT